MSNKENVMVCWHSERHGVEVLVNAITALNNLGVALEKVIYLLQPRQAGKAPEMLEGIPIQPVLVPLQNPTSHEEIYAAVRRHVIPLLQGGARFHINVSPGTPAMHAVWLILHAGGALPTNSRLWSSQFEPERKKCRIDEVTFPVTTYLSELRKLARTQPALAIYEPEPASVARRAAFDRLHRFAGVTGAPLLLLGERGTGKTRLVETFITTLKQRKRVVTVPCGGLDSSLAESALFGHSRGAFTGAAVNRPGHLKEADGGILFLDEVQDLPQTAQRKLVRTLQDRQRRFRPLGSDREISVDFEMVCASNLPLAELRNRLDADFFDRVSHLSVNIPPLRECRADLKGDWQAVWRELTGDPAQETPPPWSEELAQALQEHPLPGNLRDLQRLAMMLIAWREENSVGRALAEWRSLGSPSAPTNAEFGSGSRQQRIKEFSASLARWAKERHGTWTAAAQALECDERTLRKDGVR
ncbi:MAG: type 4 fimbriae expression regulatory protein pilR [Limisphaerales bacterium]|nr:MAG: type 4 fimbriae expression regulatory protein pilR [Limisphaerales bacterium]TXT49048.1 MAG: type 4 fimbriae expression regulatory protein pilR [Limisphaerales bacterium]